MYGYGAGKGPEWRKGSNFKAYSESKLWDNMGPDKKKKEPEVKKDTWIQCNQCGYGLLDNGSAFIETDREGAACPFCGSGILTRSSMD